MHRSLAGDRQMTDGVETAELIIQVEHCWSTDYRIGLSGWAVSKIGRLERLELLCGDASVPVEQWLSRPDIRLRYPEYLADDRCGFVVEIERRATHRLTAKARINGEIAFAAFKADVQEPTKDTSAPALPIWAKFIEEVNERKLQVLEIGSRCFLPSSENRRHFFTDGLYTGFDYHSGNNVDVVGDAHCLTRFFEGRKFGAIFSLSVMEHLAMPWVAALEMIVSVAPTPPCE